MEDVEKSTDPPNHVILTNPGDLKWPSLVQIHDGKNSVFNFSLSSRRHYHGATAFISNAT